MVRRGMPLSLALVVSAFLLIAALDAASQTLDSFTIGRVVRFAPGSDKARAALQRTPSAREIVAGDFVMAAEDLDDDGHREIIVRARSSPPCRGGSCPLVILRESPGGIETLLSQNVTGELALTTEKVGGYRALAELDATGQIAVDARPGSPLYGKQLAYTMRTGGQTPPVVVATSKQAPPQTAASDSKEAMERTLTQKYVGTYDTDELLKEPKVRAELTQLLGQELRHLHSNLNTHGQVAFSGASLAISGNAAHMGGEEEAVVCIDAYAMLVHAAIFSRGTITVFSRTKDYKHLPQCITDWITLANSGNRGPSEKPKNVQVTGPR